MTETGDEPQRIMLPRLGTHITAWGHGHSCDSDGPHDGPCICACGVPQGFDTDGSQD